MRKKRLKACIITMNNTSCNFGNKLQNYASKVVLERMGFRVDTLAFQKQPNPINMVVRMVLNRLSGYHFTPTNAGLKRSLKYYYFVRKNIPTKKVHSNFGRLSHKYDYFIIGSDQVWNPEWYDEIKKEIYLLTFARTEQKICMAPSFGISELPEEWKDWFKENLRNFPNLGVREKSGAEIIRALTGQEAMVMVDPTMLLTAEDWRTISNISPARPADQGYILTCFLGEKQSEWISQIDSIAKHRNLRILNLLLISEPELFETAPDEFIDLIDHAALVCTDSFHACVFSILFDKPFLVYRRMDGYKDMFSRIESLLELLHLQKRMPGKVEEKDYFWHDYRETNVILEEERKKTEHFLKESVFHM